MAKKGGKISPATEWKPGQSGNPNGRPRKIPALDSLLSKIPESDFQKVIDALVAKAKKGDVRATEVLLDRSYGKAKQELKVENSQKQVIVIGDQTIEF